MVKAKNLPEPLSVRVKETAGCAVLIENTCREGEVLAANFGRVGIQHHQGLESLHALAVDPLGDHRFRIVTTNESWKLQDFSRFGVSQQRIDDIDANGPRNLLAIGAVDHFTVHIGPKANDLSVAVADRFTGSHAAVWRLGLFNRKVNVGLMIDLIGKDSEAENPGLFHQTLDAIHFLLLNFRNDDFDL